MDVDILAELIGESPAMAGILQTLQRLLAAQTRARRPPPVLLLGETGVGKSLLARALHRASSPRAEATFVDVNCAAIPTALLEAELFGFERGAFTDARHAKPGLFAGGGRGDPVSRRGRAPASGVPGQAAEGSRGGRGAAPGGDARPAGRRVDHRRHQRGAGVGRPRPSLPVGPLPSPGGGHRPPACPPSAPGRHPPTRRAVPARGVCRNGATPEDADGGGPGRSARVRLARERPRAEERHHPRRAPDRGVRGVAGGPPASAGSRAGEGSPAPDRRDSGAGAAGGGRPERGPARPARAGPARHGVERLPGRRPPRAQPQPAPVSHRQARSGPRASGRAGGPRDRHRDSARGPTGRPALSRHEPDRPGARASRHRATARCPPSGDAHGDRRGRQDPAGPDRRRAAPRALPGRGLVRRAGQRGGRRPGRAGGRVRAGPPRGGVATAAGDPRRRARRGVRRC